MEMTGGLFTVTFAVPSVTFAALARIVADPAATPVTSTGMLVTPEPNEALDGTVTAAVFVEVRVTDRPPVGAGAERSKLMLCVPPALTVTT